MVPLAPARIHPRSDEESARMFVKTNPRNHQEKSSKILVYFLALIVISSAVLLVFASIVLRANTPRLKLRSVSVKNLVHINSTFNGTLVTELTLRNQNFGSFRFRNGTGEVFYGSVTVGEMKIREGRVRARATEGLKVTVDVRSNQFVEARNLSSDLNSGVLKLSSHVQLHGRVNLLNIIKRKKRPEMSCSMTLVLRSKSIEDLVCD
ncbi:hypothetical protein JRO89_XS13G0153100 [Xanthoceras sorbifolium]|uniref:Late embryogenesis abundant protein LEA-2 subgroup domain-containing protein n=1 Tax=Xanthoceras sorbifolium TaxID=99658 RepID=A0ABQ8H8E0_9ROSI|nr:hypothetical protein JRO89_XS13G0153100 [Xanthoceras sorbifolium]